MKFPRWLAWATGALFVLFGLPVLLVAVFGWNWLRAPIERMVQDKTGRALVIHGDLRISPAWPAPRIRAEGVTFANPAWAAEKNMLATEALEVSLSLPQLVNRIIEFPEVSLTRPVIYLEAGSAGRRNWLLDRAQQDEGAFPWIGRLVFDHGTLGFDDAAGKTGIRAELSSTQATSGGADGTIISASGRYRGLPLKASGSGGPVLAIRDEAKPYPLRINATIGPTTVRADGTITGLASLAGVDLRVALKGGSLEELYGLFGIALPATRNYATEGHLSRAGSKWRYDKFAGTVGDSDIAGSLEVDSAGKRPSLVADLVSRRLDMQDLGAVIGARPGSLERARAAAVAPASSATPQAASPVPLAGARVAHVLPDLPFNAERWDSVDADVKLTAHALVGVGKWPLENVLAHLLLRDSVLKLEPLDFGMAGGHLDTAITLDGRASPIHTQARVRVRDMRIGRLFPAVAASRNSVGRINGEITLSGSGNSVGRMLATSNGKLRVVVARGEISRLMMEQAGLHLWEILTIKMTGDKLIHLRCAVADFDIAKGLMQSNLLVFDTEVTTIAGAGSIDLGSEKLDLTLNQKTKNTSPLALRSPIHIAGTLAVPEVGVDKGRVALRAVGAVALAIINPLLALIPLIDAGPGKDSDCGQLVRATLVQNNAKTP